MHYCPEGVEVRQAKMLDCENKADVYICDEADELVEKCAVVFS